MLAKVVVAREMFIALRTVVMPLRLLIMLLQTVVIRENLPAGVAVTVDVFIMLFKIIFIVEVFLAVLTISMVSALNPMLFQATPGREVFITAPADIVLR